MIIILNINQNLQINNQNASYATKGEKWNSFTATELNDFCKWGLVFIL